MMVFGFIGVVLIILGFLFIVQSPCLESGDIKSPNEFIIKRLKKQYSKRNKKFQSASRQSIFCLNYFGSSWNPIIWLIPY